MKFKLWCLATRPAFLSITLVAVLLGLSYAGYQTGALPDDAPLRIGLCLLGALLAHAGANVINDVADADNGTDERNTDRIAPFTGGSRFIQEGRLPRHEMLRLAIALLFSSGMCGLLLLSLTNLRLIWFGVAGLFLGVAYSMPPFALMSRGMGEVAVIAAWALIVAGSDFVIRRSFSPEIWLIALPLAVQAGLILLVNQIPDVRADASAGKRNWVVRQGPERAWIPYLAGILMANGGLILAWHLASLPTSGLIALGLVPLGIHATRLIARFWHDPSHLIVAIRLTLLQAHVTGLIMTTAFFIDPLLRKTP